MKKILATLFLAILPIVGFAQQQSGQWRPPKHKKSHWRAPKRAVRPEVIDVWRPYKIADNWMVDLHIGTGASLGENRNGHGAASLFGTMYGIGVAKQTSYLWSTGLDFNYAQRFGWVADAKTPLPDLITPGKYRFSMATIWLDERISLTKAMCAYDELRKWDVMALAGVGVNYSMGANRETQYWNKYGEDYAIDYTSNINLALHTGVRIQYAASSSVDVWGQGTIAFIGDSHNALSHTGGMEPNPEFSLGVTLHVADSYGDYRYYRVRRNEAPLLRKQSEEVMQLLQQEAERDANRANNERVDFGKMMHTHVAFYTDRIYITEHQRNNIKVVADFLNQHPNVNIVVRGYSGATRRCETQGLHLAQHRAETVQKMLIEHFGIDESRVKLWYDENATSPSPMKGEWIDAVEFQMVQGE